MIMLYWLERVVPSLADLNYFYLFFFSWILFGLLFLCRVKRTLLKGFNWCQTCPSFKLFTYKVMAAGWISTKCCWLFSFQHQRVRFLDIEYRDLFDSFFKERTKIKKLVFFFKPEIITNRLSMGFGYSSSNIQRIKRSSE